MLRQNESGSMRWQQLKATTMNNNIEVMKSVWRRVKRPSAAKLRRIKAKAELEARVTLRYMALLAAVPDNADDGLRADGAWSGRWAGSIQSSDHGGHDLRECARVVGQTRGSESLNSPPTERSSGGGTTIKVD